MPCIKNLFSISWHEGHLTANSVEEALAGTSHVRPKVLCALQHPVSGEFGVVSMIKLLAICNIYNVVIKIFMGRLCGVGIDKTHQ